MLLYKKIRARGARAKPDWESEGPEHASAARLTRGALGQIGRKVSWSVEKEEVVGQSVAGPMPHYTKVRGWAPPAAHRRRNSCATDGDSEKSQEKMLMRIPSAGNMSGKLHVASGCCC